MSKSLMLVFSNALEGQDEAFNEWYDTRHLPDVVDCPGVVAARRYDMTVFEPPVGDDLPTLPPPSHRYLAVYELDGEVDDVLAGLMARMAQGKMPLSETLDLSTVSMTIWGPRRQDVSN
ncbi:DUF4286 family protein [Mycobacterium sp. URHB0044]|jgi:hypothetical protein|uniref:DUF4286 family protein n=1 Tax=Mycobacterium sp. URHB0044 TaxID=1380386 RepID=UPI00048F5A22|nr:DUF4286 family protein [Mycobacterium sp. URHB0044]